jgi:glycosyltransferase involved in cell wall biosynthesis
MLKLVSFASLVTQSATPTAIQANSETTLFSQVATDEAEKVSVVLPVYNESAYINKTFDSILEFSKSHPNYHFIFVDDGSTDRTQAILNQRIESSKTSKIKLISYVTNKGKGYAVKQGVESASGEYICFIDSDLAYSLDHLEVIVKNLKHFDVVIGCRNLHIESVKHVKLIRKLSGKIFNLLSRKVLNLQLRDMQAGLKGFKGEAAKEIFKKQGIKGFSFDVELMYLTKKQGYTLLEIPARVSNEHLQKASKINLLRDSIEMFFSLLEIKRNDQSGRYG